MHSFLEQWSVRLGVRTPGFHPGNTGSIPVRTTKTNQLRWLVFFVLGVVCILRKPWQGKPLPPAPSLLGEGEREFLAVVMECFDHFFII